MTAELTLDERRALAALAEIAADREGWLKSGELRWTARVLGVNRVFNAVAIPEDGDQILEKGQVFEYLTWFFLYERSLMSLVLSDLLKPCFLTSWHLSGRHGKERGEAITRLKFTIDRYLSVIGFESRTERDSKGVEGIRLTVLPAELVESRREDHTRLHEVLSTLCPPAYTALTGAFDQYMDDGDDAPRQSIDSCRNACENLFKLVAGKEKWGESLDQVLGSESMERLSKSIYGYLSGTGTHSPKPRTREDALVSIRLTEDLLRTVLVRTGRW